MHEVSVAASYVGVLLQNETCVDRETGHDLQNDETSILEDFGKGAASVKGI